MTTFEDWHNAHAKYMEPADIAHWCRDAYEAGRTSRDLEVADLSGVILCHAEPVGDAAGLSKRW